MKSLKITIEPLSSFASEIQSDTLFGQFAWTYLELYGQERLKSDIIDKRPSIVFSDGFHAGHLPYPVLAPLKEEDFEKILTNESGGLGGKDKEKRAVYIKKELKKEKFIKAELLKQTADNLSSEALVHKILSDKNYYDDKEKEGKEEAFLSAARIYKNSISRITGTTGIEGGLYSVSENFFDIEKSSEKNLIDIYIIYNDNLDSKIILEALKIIGINGFGRDKSTGRGRFEIADYKEDIERLKYDAKKNYDGIISLSTGVLSDNLEVNYAKTFTKFPKHGGMLAASGKYIKKPAIFYRAGSTFRLKKDNGSYNYGKDLDLFGEEADCRNYIHNARIVPYFIKFKDSESSNGE